MGTCGPQMAWKGEGGLVLLNVRFHWNSRESITTKRSLVVLVLLFIRNPTYLPIQYNYLVILNILNKTLIR